MSNHINWKASLQNLFGDFITSVGGWIHQLKNISQADAEKELKGYANTLTDCSNEFSNVKIAYNEMVEAYLKQYPPKFSDKFAENLIEYDKLILFSLRSDNKKLLLKWGIEYPRDNKELSWLSNPAEISKHIKGLEKLRDDKAGAEDDYNYLIEHLKSTLHPLTSL